MTLTKRGLQLKIESYLFLTENTIFDFRRDRILLICKNVNFRILVWSKLIQTRLVRMGLSFVIGIVVTRLVIEADLDRIKRDFTKTV